MVFGHCLLDPITTTSEDDSIDLPTSGTWKNLRLELESVESAEPVDIRFLSQSRSRRHSWCILALSPLLIIYPSMDPNHLDQLNSINMYPNFESTNWFALLSLRDIGCCLLELLHHPQMLGITIHSQLIGGQIESFPQVFGENKKYLSCHHLVQYPHPLRHICLAI